MTRMTRAVRLTLFLCLVLGACSSDDAADGTTTSPTPPTTTISTSTQPPPTTTVVETMDDLEVIQAGVAALYSGDADRAMELFALTDFSDEQIENKAAYEAAIGARIALDCTAAGTDGAFTCNIRYENELSDVTGSVDPAETSRVVVEDGVIREFTFPDQRLMMASVGGFLAGRDQVCADEFFSLFPQEPFLLPTADCVDLLLEHLDEWASYWVGG